MKPYKLFASIAVVGLFTACCSDEEPVVKDEGTPVNFVLGGHIETKSVTQPGGSDGTTYSTTFKAADAIGLSAKGTVKNEVNAKLTVNTNGSGLDCEQGQIIVLPENGNATFFAYAPYSEPAQTAAGTVNLAVLADQTTADNFNASNLLTSKVTGVTPESPTAKFTFSPRTALVRIEMSGTVGATVTSVAALAKTGVTWTYSDTEDKVEVTGTATPIALLHENASDTEATKQIFTAFVPAQEIVTGTQFLTMETGQKKYIFKPKTNFSLVAGTVNKFSIQIGENGEVVVIASAIKVDDWGTTDVTTVEGEVTEEGETGGDTPSNPDPEEPAGDDTALIVMPTGDITDVTGIGSVKAGTPWGYNTTGLVSATYANNTFMVVSKSTCAWATPALMYFGSAVLESGRYTLSFNIKSDLEASNTADGKIQITVMAASASTNFDLYPQIQGTTDAEKKYMSTFTTGITSASSKSVKVVFDTSLYINAGVGTGDKTDAAWVAASETQYQSGFKIAIGFNGSAESNITYTITDLVLTKNTN